MTTVRPATDRDAELLVRWHADPEVSRYWDDETFSSDEMRSRLARQDVDSYVIEADGEPIGYIQAWWEDDEPRAAVSTCSSSLPRADAVWDRMRHARSRSHLFASGWTRVTVDPYVSNERAIRAWRSAGFVRVDDRERAPDEDHTAPWLLMAFRPGQSA